MTMNPNPIDALVGDLAPVKPLRPRQAIAGVAVTVAVAVAVVAAHYGLRPDILAGKPDPMVLLREGMLLILGGAALAAVIRAARPGVGPVNSGWLWAVGAASLFPLTAILLAIASGGFPVTDAMSPYARYCLGISIGSGAAIGAVLTLWLRHGAPTNADRAGWLVGLVAGSFGTFAYGLHCPSTSISYIGLWYTVAVVACASVGRILVPRLVRW